MSEKSLDTHGRWRSVTVAFRVSQEEARLIDAQVALSGLTKQEYITSRLLGREVKVIPSSRVQRALREHMSAVYLELRRIRDSSELSPELEAVIGLLAEEFVALGDERSDVEREDDRVGVPVPRRCRDGDPKGCDARRGGRRDTRGRERRERDRPEREVGGNRRWVINGDPQEDWWIEVDQNGQRSSGDWEYDRDTMTAVCSIG